MIGRILVSLTAFALAGFFLLVLIGLWDGYQQETKALGFSGIYERYLASQAGFADDARAYRADSGCGRNSSDRGMTSSN